MLNFEFKHDELNKLLFVRRDFNEISIPTNITRICKDDIYLILWKFNNIHGKFLL